MAEAEGSSPLLLPPPPPPPPGMAEVEAPTAAETDKKHFSGSGSSAMDVDRSRFPYCVVWTPIPVLTWFFPIIGHMGICTSTGVIRDFAGPYFVSEDNMAFGKPAKYWKLDPAQVYASGPNAWDTAVHDASEEYKHRMCRGLREDLAALRPPPGHHPDCQPRLQPSVMAASWP
uniref:transmembrane protein 222 isoform X2 n=1 Tax=Halichoerus grypus TaxID=9711 RepID=UPI0016594AEC|nr:transmembrane protein 222 isoform X2 [Halichoerus grypus]